MVPSNESASAEMWQVQIFSPLHSPSLIQSFNYFLAATCLITRDNAPIIYVHIGSSAALDTGSLCTTEGSSNHQKAMMTCDIKDTNKYAELTPSGPNESCEIKNS